ncbi:glycoside hydrolase family 3 N-terminal domain-containing protein [Bradyrhizobium sp. S69]|uniref:glycoside hydrolase family 3 N-terminal domain-containing protein n=1 Tax=Bradyrhizobium sp. S69 TaxID=1641856 RepID=UPI00131C34F7|nr:glycoside hydrolase family 3 N-terminal domain-containing protein [Bradyrhizobium sp. S69]
MLKRLATIALWCVAPVLIFVSAKLYDPYLVMIRGWGHVALMISELAGIGALLVCGYWRRGGVAGKVLVLLWCLAPLAMLSAVTVFHGRKHAVLHAEGRRAQELGRHFIVGYSSFDEIASLAAKGLIGGIYVTRHNIEGRTADALRSEISQLQAIRSARGLPPLIVAADQEGGIVSHMSPPLTGLPALATLAALPPAERLAKAEEFGRTQGRELAALGVTLNFSPVVDLLRTGAPNPLDFNSLISRRAISGDPEVVASIAAAYARGLEANGVEATVKHFPGLGRVQADTHHFRADLATPVAELEATDWMPFRQVLARSSAYLMVGHVAVTAIDPNKAASHSRRVINDLIRNKWGYQGIIITDDLVMGPIYEHGVCAAVVEALNAGVDLLLVAYDGLQFYRMYDCALGASTGGRLDETMLNNSLARLSSKIPAAGRGE